jgi:hypothetical protein
MTRQRFDSDPVPRKLKEPWRLGDRVQLEMAVSLPVPGKEFELRLPLAGMRLASAGFLVSSSKDVGL